MRLDQTTSKLFNIYPREVGNPKRQVIYTEDQFINFLVQNDGINNCFTSVYPNSKIIDKIFFDLDGDGALADAKVLYKSLIGKGYNVIPVVSGKKGIHLYLLLKKAKYGDHVKDYLLRASYAILKEAFNGEIGKSVDTCVLGDIQRLCRIPNTQRPPELRAYCTYLPPSFIDWDEAKLALHAKLPCYWSYRYNDKYPTLPELIGNDDGSIPKGGHEASNKPIIFRASPQIGSNNLGYKLLERLIKKRCVFKQIATIHPTHSARIAATIELLNCGMSEEDILYMYSLLAWEDFDRATTVYQIRSIQKTAYLPYSCRKLKSQGMVEDSDCAECFINK